MDIHKEADAILAQLKFEDEHPEPAGISVESATRHLRKHLVTVLGPKWFLATIEAHRHLDGQCLYVAALNCKQCRRVHTYVVQIDGDGVMNFATPLEEED